jgi:pilus assembly protein Flp/PilA
MTNLTIARRAASRFFADTSGATAVEYALVASGIGAFVAGTVWSLGSGVKGFFTTLAGLF